MSEAARLLRVCVTGPESTGKTTLAARLAERAGTAWSAEASRGYAERKLTPLDASDVVPIAAAQAALEDDAVHRARTLGARVVLHDTDLASTVVYAAHYYGAVPRTVHDDAIRRRADLYLLCDVDVPWIPDGVRDQPDARAELFTHFHETLRAAGSHPVIVRGSWDERWEIATAAFDDLVRSISLGRP